MKTGGPPRLPGPPVAFLRTGRVRSLHGGLGDGVYRGEACLTRYDPGVRLRSETLQVSGIRCERCVMRLGGALRGLEGLESANANLMGEVHLSWDDERVDRETILAALARAGFRPVGTA